MTACDDTCHCTAEGDRGLVVTGAGESTDPFVVSPDSLRTIPSTWETASDLPTLGNEEIGQLAFVIDSGLVYVWAGVGSGGFTDGWQVWAPDHGEIAIGDTAIDATGVPVTTAALTLPDGRWDIIASGYLDVTVAASTVTQVTMDLIDTTSSTVYDSRAVTLANDIASPGARAMPFMLQRMVTSGPGSSDPADSDKLIAIQMTRTSAEASVGTLKQTAMRAVRVSSHGGF